VTIQCETIGEIVLYRLAQKPLNLLELNF